MQNSQPQPPSGESEGRVDFVEGGAGLDELHAQVAAAEAHILDLERDLEGVAAREAGLSNDLEVARSHRSALDHQLGDARQEASRLALKIALEMRATAVAEAEQILADAQRESESLVNAGREQLQVMESEAAGRSAELEAEHQALSEQLQAMEALYGELQATLQLVAETSLKELVKTQDSARQLDLGKPSGPRPEPASEQTAMAETEDGSVANHEAPSNSAGDHPSAIEIPPLTGSA